VDTVDPGTERSYRDREFMTQDAGVCEKGLFAGERVQVRPADADSAHLHLDPTGCRWFGRSDLLQTQITDVVQCQLEHDRLLSLWCVVVTLSFRRGDAPLD
jgi:hypothetical protein